MHIGPVESGHYKGVQRKLVSESGRLVEEFVDRMNAQERPEFVVNLGDSIEDVNSRDIDIQSFKKSIALLSGLKMPVYSMVGNHDVKTLTQEEVAKKVGKARSTVANMLRLLDLPSEIQEAIASGTISTGSARAILSLQDDKSRLKFFKKLLYVIVYNTI